MKRLFLVLFLVAITSCSEDVLLKSFLNNNAKFRAEVYTEVLAQKEGNVIFSPLGVTFLLSFAQNGAKSGTFEELHNALSLPSNHTELEIAMKYLRRMAKEAKHSKLRAVIKTYVKKGFPIKDDFLRVTREIFIACCFVENVDFLDSGAANTINQWVSQQTEERIIKLVDQSDFNANTKLLLINPLFFQANWMHPFKGVNTKPRDFHVSESKSSKVDSMELVSYWNFFESSELDARLVELEFEGGEGAMVIILPNQKDGYKALEAKAENYGVMRNLTRKRLRLVLPKFQIKTEAKLKPVLQKVGIVKAFQEDEADFSGISGNPGDLVLNEVIQKAFVRIDENGVEATAASVASVSAPYSLDINDKSPIEDFVIDHPFLFVIRLHDIVMFAGRVVNPSELV